MDKVKIALAQLKKHHFWVLSLLVAIMALTTWSMATGDLDAIFTARKGAVEGKFNSVLAVNGQTDPPNEGVIAAIREQIDGAPTRNVKGVRQSVLEAWEALYKEQTEKNQLPEVLKNPRFREHFKQLVEGKITDLSDDDRAYYMNEIQKYFPKLIEEVDVRRPKGEGTEGGGRGGGGRPTGLRSRERMGMGRRVESEADQRDLVGVVEWDDKNLEDIERQFFWEEVPNTDRVLLRKRTSGCMKRCCGSSRTSTRAPPATTTPRSSGSRPWRSAATPWRAGRGSGNRSFTASAAATGQWAWVAPWECR